MNSTRRLLFLLTLIPPALLISAARNEPPTPTPDAATPTPTESFIPLEGVVVVAAGEGHTCALDEQGGVWCWGTNWAGQLGDGTTDRRESATQVVGLTSGVRALAAGENFTCALTEAGGVKCWGRNAEGELGNGLTEDLSIPADVVGLESGVVALAAGTWHACAVGEGGRVLCWGDNNTGKANGNPEESELDLLTPEMVQGLQGTYVAVVAGFRHSCALSDQGAVECWGGAAIPGVNQFRHGPLPVPGLESGVALLSSGPLHTCAALADGGLRCWGNNSHGQLGSGSVGDEADMVSVTGLPGPVEGLSAGGGHTCARIDGRALCWGDNSFGQLGDGSTDDRTVPAEVLDLGGGVGSLSAGYAHTCAVAKGEVSCWGAHLSGQLGEGLRPYATRPVEVLGLGDGATALAAGETHSCAVMRDGGLVCWGDDTSGGLGDGRGGLRGRPVAVSGLEGGVAAVSAGDGFTCSRTDVGDAWCWGRNTYGELGSGSDDSSTLPVEVVGLHGRAAAVAAGSYHACALTTSGGVLCWGHNDYGQLGDGGVLEESNAPVDVVGLGSGVKAITAGSDHSCALLESGELYCWGQVLEQQSAELTAPPVRMQGLPADVASIFEADYDTCAITEQGEVYCLQAGGTGGEVFEPVELTFPVVAAAGGLNFTCVLDEAGGVWCEGQNEFGQLGDGTTESRPDYARVDGLASGVTTIAAGEYHACALLENGSVRCWGDNNFGQLGDGTVPRSLPVAVTRLWEVIARAFREPGTFVPELTTYIPTPLDVSTDPAVIGTNLALAALAMLPFAVAAELLTRTLAERQISLPGRYDPSVRFPAVRRRLGSVLERLLRPGRLREAVRVIIILLFYGLVFSLLDRSWKPFSLGGLVLLLYMTIAYGVVGLADDIAQWRAAQRWQIPATFKLRPTNVLLAVASTATTRLLNLVPGLMFGTPEALEVEEARLDEHNRARLTRVSALALLGVALVLWVPSALTAWLQDRRVSGGLATALGGLEAFLVLTFAVALENLFVKLLGLPGSMGETLRRRSRWLWLGALLASGFAFYHTLLNPRGELATALQEGNVRIFLAAVAAFVLVSFSLSLYFRWRERGVSLGLKLPTLPRRSKAAPARLDAAPRLASTMDQAPLVEATAAAGPPLLPAVQAAVAEAPADQPAPGSSTGPEALAARETAADAAVTTFPGAAEGTKKCPMCAETIKLEARICRYCRTGFEVIVQGYCSRDHAVVALDPRERCPRCGGQVVDRQVKSRWLGEGSGPPIAARGQDEAKLPTSSVQDAPAESPPPTIPSKRPWRRRALPRAGRVALPAAGATALAIAALLLLQRFDLGGMEQPLPSSTERPTQAPTRAPSATNRPMPTPDIGSTATASAILEQAEAFVRPVLAAVEGRSPHASQDFQTRQDWGLQPGTGIENGKLVFGLSGEHSWFAPIADYQDFLYEFEFTPITASPETRLDVFLRQQDNHFYAIGISPILGTWVVEVHDDQHAVDPLVATGQAELPIFNEPNLMQLIAFGDRMALVLNGKAVAYFEDGSIQGTWHPIVVHAEQGYSEIEIDNIKMWNLRMLPIEW